jgi:tripartite-type tricarboxylate transporter receptor subunit TctC
MKIRSAMRDKCTALLATLAIGCAISAGASAQDDAARNFPNKPIRIIVGFAAGGGMDYLARILAAKMFEGDGRSAIVENRVGGNGIIGADLVARATPDGYVVMVAPSTVVTVNAAVYPRLPYAPQRDFAPISQLATFPYILSVNASTPITSVRELVAWAKANPTKSNYGGAAAIFLLMSHLFKKETGAPLEYIPYKSTAEGITALLAGEVSMTITDAGPISGALKNGQARALAVTFPQRVPAYPDVPTMAEAGVPGMNIVGWAGLFAPAATPPAIVQKLRDEVARVLHLPDIQQQLRARETEPVGSTSEELRKVMDADLARFVAVAQENNVRLEQ